MDLREAILKEHSKKQTTAIAGYIGNKQLLFDKLMDLFFNAEYRVVQRAAWVVWYCGEAHPNLVRKHIPKLIHNLDTPNLHDAVKRNTLRVLLFIKVPDELLGKLVDICFRFAYSAIESIAVKAYSINSLVEIYKKHPELKQELLSLLSEIQNDESAAIRSCAKNGLKALKQKEI